MLKLIIIGSDSFIATKFYNAVKSEIDTKLITRISSDKKLEIVKENLFELDKNDFVGYNIVINFAAIVHQPKLKNTNLYYKINTDLPLHLAKTAKKAGVKHFIQMSSVAVYGNAHKITNNTTTAPINDYGHSKLKADQSLISLQTNDFNISVIRPPMVYGGGKAPGNMLRLIELAEKGFPLPFLGINNQRDFIHVYNLVDAIKVIIKNNLTGIIFPTDLKSASTEQIMKIIQQNSSKKVRLFRIPGIIRNIIKRTVPLLFEKLFGDSVVECNIPKEIYTPVYNIENGIKEMMNK